MYIMYTKKLCFTFPKDLKMLTEPDNIPLIFCITSLFIQTFKGALPYDFNVFAVQDYKAFTA